MATAIKFFLFFLISCTMAPSLQADTDKIFGNDLLLLGGIGKYQIMLKLEGPGDEDGWPSECFEVSGVYFYKSVMDPIQLEGTVCREKGNFLLYHDKGGKNEECFEGKLRDGFLHWEGLWKKGDKQLPLDVTAAEELVGESAVARFMDFVAMTMESDGEEPPMEGAVVGSAGVDGEGRPFIDRFQPGWNGAVTFFGPTRLDYYTDYTSTARSTMFGYTYQLLADGVHVVELSWWHNFDKMEDLSDFGYQVAVWKWENGEFEMVEGVLPEAVEAYGSGEGSSYEDGQMYVEVGPDRMKLRLKDQSNLMRWEKGKFVK